MLVWSLEKMKVPLIVPSCEQEEEEIQMVLKRTKGWLFQNEDLADILL